MDARARARENDQMTVSPLPRLGDVVLGRDVAGRTLRVSGHPASGRVVLSQHSTAPAIAPRTTCAAAASERTGSIPCARTRVSFCNRRRATGDGGSWLP